MPLIEGKAAKTKKGFSENVRREMHAGKPQKQAVAIAYSEAGEHKKKKHHKETYEKPTLKARKHHESKHHKKDK